jgi:hypothetical protein
MRIFALLATLALFGLMPFAASAQQRAPSPPQAPAAQSADSINYNKILAIGAGVVVGAVVFESVAVGDAMVLVGGVAGGLIGAWWYENSGDPRLNIRQSAAMTIAYDGEPVAQSY